MDDLLEEISESSEVPHAGYDLPSNWVTEFFQQKRKKPTKPADLLIPLTRLSEEHLSDAVRSERAGHGRCNKRVQPFLQKATRTGRPSRDGANGGVSRVRVKDLSPIDAAREATAKRGQRRGRNRRNSTDQSQSDLPRNRDVLVGWHSLLNEIASSSRRLRAARGAQDALARPPESRPRTEESRAGSPPAIADESDDGLWLSYRISEETVPNAILLRMWNYAVDPRKDDGCLASLERVPRLTVTKREVQPLPVVHDLLQWRMTNKRRRETRKAKKEAERNPSLDEMLAAIFGEEDMDLLSLDEAQLLKHRADASLDAALAWLAEHGSPMGAPPGGAATPKAGPPGTPKEKQQRQKLEELELLKEIQLILTNDADEALEAFRDLEPKLVGALRRGRRGAFDEGKASAKLALSIADLQARQDKNVVRCKTLRRGFEHSRAIRSLPSDPVKNEPIAEQHMQEVVKSFTSVVDNCERRTLRFHEAFLRRQGHLSERLSRRVKRIQNDHCEIQSKKQQSILPASVVSDASAPILSVLHFLKPHRMNVERKRQDAHSIYMRQVERIQHFTHLLADPNREPERGEVYLSQCFRHVLAAGLAVDKCYFFRVLRNLQREDFQKVFTVNFLAACCDAFSIPVRDYIDYLKCHDLPLLGPKAARASALPYDDTAAWDAVMLEPLKETFITHDATLAEVPLFPILPSETPHTSELVSREDPLHEILQTTVFDAVLQRYGIGSKTSDEAELRRLNTNASSAVAATPDGLNSGAEGSLESWARPIPRPPVMIAQPHNFRRGKFQAGSRPFEPHGHKTLKKMWGVAEPMGDSRRAAFVKKQPTRGQMEVVPEDVPEAMSP